MYYLKVEKNGLYPLQANTYTNEKNLSITNQALIFTVATALLEPPLISVIHVTSMQNEGDVSGLLCLFVFWHSYSKSFDLHGNLIRPGAWPKLEVTFGAHQDAGIQKVFVAFHIITLQTNTFNREKKWERQVNITEVTSFWIQRLN